MMSMDDDEDQLQLHCGGGGDDLLLHGKDQEEKRNDYDDEHDELQDDHETNDGDGQGRSLLFQSSHDAAMLQTDSLVSGGGSGAELPDGFAPVPSLPMVYKWMVSSIGESMAQSMPMSVRVSMPLDSIRSISQGISLRNPGQADEIFKNLWITAHTRHFHGVIVLGWARMQQNEACNPDTCPKMIVGKTEVRWKQSPEEIASYEEGDPYRVTYLSLPAAEYVDRSLAENHGILSESSITPFVGGQAQPGVSDYEFSFSNFFIPTMKEVYKYIMRVYTHLYLYHVDLLPQTFSSFLAPPLPAGVVPAAQKELEKYAFHLAYFLNFGLSFHLITHEQIDSLGHAMKYFIWNLPDMEDQVPATFKAAVAANAGVQDQFDPNSPAHHASSNPFLQSTTAGSMYSNGYGQQQMQQSPMQSPVQSPQAQSPAPGMQLPGMFAGMDMSSMNPMMMMMMMQQAAATAAAQAAAIQQPARESAADEQIKKLQEEVERLRVAATAPKAAASSSFAPPINTNVNPANGGGGGGNFTLDRAKAVSNIDPQLIALKRTELIKKSIAPFIAHNLAIAKVEQDLKDSNFPSGYVPSPGYGTNGYILGKDLGSSGGKPSSNNGSLSSFGFSGDEGHSPKILSPSSRERQRGGDDGGREESGRGRNSAGGKEKEHSSKRSRSSKSHTRGSESSGGSDSEETDSGSSTNSKSQNQPTHSRPDASLLGNSSGSKGDKEGKDSSAADKQAGGAAGSDAAAGKPGAKKPIRRPIPQQRPPAREPSCGQRLCF